MSYTIEVRKMSDLSDFEVIIEIGGKSRLTGFTLFPHLKTYLQALRDTLELQGFPVQSISWHLSPAAPKSTVLRWTFDNHQCVSEEIRPNGQIVRGRK